MGDFSQGFRYATKCVNGGEKILQDYMKKNGISDGHRGDVHSYLSRSFKLGTVVGWTLPPASVAVGLGLWGAHLLGYLK